MLKVWYKPLHGYFLFIVMGFAMIVPRKYITVIDISCHKNPTVDHNRHNGKIASNI